MTAMMEVWPRAKETTRSVPGRTHELRSSCCPHEGPPLAALAAAREGPSLAARRWLVAGLLLRALLLAARGPCPARLLLAATTAARGGGVRMEAWLCRLILSWWGAAARSLWLPTVLLAAQLSCP
ncbi:hypothetical protein Dimus_029393, partial [Dionaea muscipula]